MEKDGDRRVACLHTIYDACTNGDEDHVPTMVACSSAEETPRSDSVDRDDSKGHQDAYGGPDLCLRGRNGQRIVRELERDDEARIEDDVQDHVGRELGCRDVEDILQDDGKQDQAEGCSKRDDEPAVPES